jgi:glycosyltransferase involved in cell wall biosynthesis
VGGAERQFSILIPAVRERGFDVSGLTLVDEGPFFQELVQRGVQMNCAGMRGRADLAGFRRALRHARFKPNVVVTHSINAHVIGHLIARRARALHVTTEHSGPGAPRRIHREALARLIGPRVDHAIVVSPTQIPRLLALRYRAGRIRVIPNGVPKPIVTESSPSVRSHLGVREDDFLAVLVATLRPEKSADVFLNAVQEAHRVNPRVRGLIVGGGPQLDRLTNMLTEGGAVQILGERLDVPDIINAADVACLSSSAEGVPMALLEAMALGKPVVATDVGGVAEAVEHERTGLLVPVGDERAFADGVLRLAASQTLAQELGSAAVRRHRRHFSVERMVTEYTKVFQQALEERGRLEAADLSA